MTPNDSDTQRRGKAQCETLTVEGRRVKSVEREEPAKSEFRRDYYCSTCRRLHFRDSKIGKAHDWFEREAAERV